MNKPCEHLENLTEADFATPDVPLACEECLKDGTEWVALRGGVSGHRMPEEADARPAERSEVVPVFRIHVERADPDNEEDRGQLDADHEGVESRALLNAFDEHDRGDGQSFWRTPRRQPTSYRMVPLERPTPVRRLCDCPSSLGPPQ